MTGRFLLDTGSAGDVVSMRAPTWTRFCEAQIRGDRVGITTPVLGELWAGVEYCPSRTANAVRLRRSLGLFRVWPFDVVAAEEFGRIYALLRRMGRPMQQIDIQIAAVALTLGRCTVVTRDSDFAAIPGLQVVDWSK